MDRPGAVFEKNNIKMTWQCSCHVPSILPRLVHPLSSLPVELVRMTHFQKTIYRFSTLVMRYVGKNWHNVEKYSDTFHCFWLLLFYWLLFFFSFIFESCQIKKKKNLKINWDRFFRFAKFLNSKIPRISLWSFRNYFLYYFNIFFIQIWRMFNNK